jgi:hypothetical protein
MNRLFLESDFKFSEESTQWLYQTFDFLFKEPELNHNLYRTRNFEKNFNKKVSFIGSPPLHEIKEYLKKFGIPDWYFDNEINGPDIFMATTKVSCAHHPHIDEHRVPKGLLPGGTEPIPTRFNSFILYSPDEDMCWWEDVVPGHPLVTSYDNGVVKQQLGIKGRGSFQKLLNLGPPSYVADRLYKNVSSAFVRTDCAHSISLKTPGTRFGVTVALNRKIDELLEYYNKS